ncbi:OLC1v1009916C1 [Oldenlandia corymbosa var. corymbosa]|uniref:OLC1v1009916C1 n=1 Tax=Oldenlandia corymbosa var. corymbosa TaxID=529605 RepID=A0AAV1DRM8_OLDCO|nr:OLC1v1009916C1 [Oldenlandia corymbosa var. corymbosa]
MADSPALPLELHQEILRWLPVKSLMRFKCISVTWHSIIKDPSLALVYRAGSRGLLVVEHPEPEEGTNEKTVFTFVNLNFEGYGPRTYLLRRSTVDHSKFGGDWEQMQTTMVVNGLVCFYGVKRLCLYNIATRESLEVVPVQCQVNPPNENFFAYFLGFDPVNKLYKLLLLFISKEAQTAQSRRNWKILTIGVDSSWRDICLPPMDASNNPLNKSTRLRYLDGVLYWLNGSNANHPMVAFDFFQEKFQLIPLPNPEGCPRKYNLLSFGPIAIAVMSESPESNERVIVRYNNNRRKSGELAKGNWGDEEKYVIPSEEVCLQGILPSEKLILSHYFESPAYIYLFDPVKRESKEIVLWNNPFLFPQQSNPVNYYEENIISLRSLTSISGPQ